MVAAEAAGAVRPIPERHDGDTAHARGGEEQERAVQDEDHGTNEQRIQRHEWQQCRQRVCRLSREADVQPRRVERGDGESARPRAAPAICAGESGHAQAV